jgi:outer membrane autotransporter protein
MKTLLRISVLLLAGPILVASASTVARAQGIQLGSLSGLNAAQARVGTAIDILCPKLAEMRGLTAAQTDLFNRCTDMKGGFLGPPSSAVLGTALADVTSQQTTAQGTSAIETQSPQFRSIGARLAAIRLGATGVRIGGLGLDGTTAEATPLFLGAGGASADVGDGLGVFLNAMGSFGNKNGTANEAGYDYHNVGATAGADYRFMENLVAGLAFTYLRTDANITSFALGEVDSNSYGLSLYGTYYVGPFYLDLLGGFTYNSYSTTRQIVYAPDANAVPAPANSGLGQAVNRTATADPTGWQYMFNGGAGYDFHVGALTATPYARMEYLNLQVGSYAESGADGLNLRVQKQTVDSLLSVLGGRLSYALSVPFGVLVPQVHGEWRHEILNDQRSIRAQFANDPLDTVFSVPTDKPDRDYFAVGASMSAALGKGIAAFFDFETILGLRDVTNYGFTAGVRMSF